MLCYRAKLSAPVCGRRLTLEQLSEMAEPGRGWLRGFSQANTPILGTRVLGRVITPRLNRVWLQPLDVFLARAASPMTANWPLACPASASSDHCAVPMRLAHRPVPAHHPPVLCRKPRLEIERARARAT